MKARSVTLAIVALLLVPHVFGDCKQLLEEERDYSDASYHQKKIEYALALMNDVTSLNTKQDCEADAMRFLGTFHVEAAVPRLVELLGYYRKIEHPHRLLLMTDHYPATAGLIGIGKPSVPALIAVISGNEAGSIETHNALEVIMSIYRAHPSDGIAVIQQAISAQKIGGARSDATSVYRLEKAKAEAESRWCRDQSCSS